MGAYFSNSPPGFLQRLPQKSPWIPESAVPLLCGSCSPWPGRARSAESWLWPGCGREGGACWWWGQHRPWGQPPPPHWHDLHLEREQDEVTCSFYKWNNLKNFRQKKFSIPFLKPATSAGSHYPLERKWTQTPLLQTVTRCNTSLGNRNCCYLRNLRSRHW